MGDVQGPVNAEPTKVVLSGGIALSNASTQSDITQMLRYPPYAITGHTLTLEVTPSLVVAAEQSATAGANSLVKAVSGITTTNNDIALRVTPQGKPLTYSTAATASITASAVVAAANASRRYMTIKNASGVDTLWLAAGAAAQVGYGIGVPPGGTFEMAEGYGNLSTQEFRAISSGGAITVGIQEAT